MKKEDPLRYSCIQMLGNSRKRSKKLNLDNDIDIDYLLSIAPKICPIMKRHLKYGGGNLTKYSASLDRINPKNGYIKGNVQIISNIANMMKSYATKKELNLFSMWINSKSN